MSVSERIAEQEREREQQQRQNQARRDAEKQQQIEQTKSEIATYEQQQRDLESQIKNLESESAKIELEEKQRAAAEQRKQELISSYQSRIEQIKLEKTKSLKQYFSAGGQGGAFYQTAQQKVDAREAAQKFDRQIRELERNRELALNIFEYQREYPGRTLNSQLLKEFKGGSSAGSLVLLQKRKDEILYGQEQAARETAQVQARSDVAKAENDLELLKREFSKSKTEKDSMLGAETAKFQNFDLTVSLKQRHGKMLADPFKDLPDVNPESIYGTTEAKSAQAVYTFEETEKQQKELEKLLRESSGAKQAYEIKTGFQEKNPYVGTAQAYTYKGKTLDVQGVTIEKQLNTAIPEFETLLEKEPKTTRKETLVELEESLTFGEGLGGGTNREQSVPEIIFLEPGGKEIERPDISTLWQYTKESLDLAAFDPTPSKVDLALNKYEKENLITISEFEKTEKARTAGTTTPLIDRSQLSFESGFIGQVDELADLALGKETKNPSLESLAVGDISNQIKSDLGLEPKKESEALKSLTEKSKTKGGQLWIAGTLAGSAVALAATTVVPGLLSVKLGKLAARQTLKEASEIALKLSTKTPDESFIIARRSEIAKDLKTKYPEIPESDLKKFTDKIIAEQNPNVSEIQRRKELANLLKKVAPKMTEKERAATLAKTFDDEPYTIELLNTKTALITTGTESTQSRIILYEKGGLAKIYEPPTERNILLRNILLKGKQTDAREIAASLRKQFPTMPPEKISETVKLLSKDLEQGKIIITAKQARLAQKESPLIKDTKEIISLGGRTYKVIRGTEAINYEKMDLGRYKATSKNLALLQDEKEYAFLGTEKAVRSKDLRKFPKTILGSIEIEEPYKATGIYERAKKGKKTKEPKPEKKTSEGGKARSYTEGKFGIGTEKIEIKSGKQDSIEIKSGRADLADLKELARSQARTSKPISDEVTAMANAVRITTSEKSKTTTASAQRSRQEAGTEAKQLGAQMNRVALQTGQALDTIRIQKPSIKTGLEEIDLIKTGEKLTIRTTEKQDQAGLYSLITGQSLREQLREELKYKIKITQKLRTDIETPTPTRTRTTTVPAPKPIVNITVSKKPKILKDLSGKKGKLYFRWNVNELSPGYYLPTKELTTGKTTKAVSKVERIQTRQQKIQMRETANNLSKAFIETTKTKQRRSKPKQPDPTQNLKQFNKYVNTPRKKIRFK